jgi:hypothetical protein
LSSLLRRQELHQNNEISILVEHVRRVVCPSLFSSEEINEESK